MPAPDILYVSHCVPNPPDKGEKIRAYHQLRQLAAQYRVHLACFARSQADLEAARALEPLCASVFADPLSTPPALAKAALRFAAGACLNTAFYSSPRIQRHVRELHARQPFAAAVVYTAVMFPYVPAGVPALLDMIDVDSEKWLTYAERRHPSFLYALEARRLRRLEIRFAEKAARTFFTTSAEEKLFRGFSPSSVRTAPLENGVDFDYFDPAAAAPAPGFSPRLIVFTGAMDYYPNIDAVGWFSSDVLPQLRRADPALEFVIVGRNPSKAVRNLAALPGVRVTGSVPDVRPYLKAAVAMVAPLRIARGIQNKVLEGLAMGLPVYASPVVATTFGAALPAGLTVCDTPQHYVQALAAPAPLPPAEIRQGARARFTWTTNNALLLDSLAALLGSPAPD